MTPQPLLVTFLCSSPCVNNKPENGSTLTTGAIVLGINMSISEPFRLLDLPREVRDKIYHGMLCDWPERGVYQYTMLCGEDELEFASMRRRIVPNILLANKQVYQEAKQVLLKGNLFIHIRLVVRDGFDIPTIFDPADPDHVPVVAVGYDCVALFKDLVVMTHFVDCVKCLTGLQEFGNNQIDFIILHRDLEKFCKKLHLIDLHHYILPDHNATMHNPFSKTLSPEFLNRKNQERLLCVYPKAMEGVDVFKIEGHVEQDLAEAVVARVCQEPELPHPQTFLEGLVRQKEAGDQAYRNRDLNQALKRWDATRLVLCKARHHRAWPHLKQDGGKAFTDRVTELDFDINANLVQAYSVVMRRIDKRAPNHRWQLDACGRQLARACGSAGYVGGFLHTDWTPSTLQMANIYYHSALAHRLAEHDAHSAEHWINLAAGLLPHDPVIQAEAQEIAKMQTSVRVI